MKTLLCFGDSNTHGTCPMDHIDDVRRFDADVRWPGVAARALGADWHVIEEGHPGRTTVHPDPIEGADKCGRPALTVALASHRPIDRVVIMLGTNDLKARFGVTALDIALSVELLVADVLASDCGPDRSAPEALLVAPPPISEDSWLGEMFRGGAATSQGLAARYREAAGRQGCGFFDAGSVVESTPVDGIHLEAEAHAALGRAIAAAVAGA